ncbi:hypothetical protein KJ761_01685 [Patescibacteria group bacterium]|nr:hypothetical protein [Patescibacteria group bacterium]
MTEKKVIFTCGKWSGSPPRGQMTSRKSIGWVKDESGEYWEVLFWLVENKSAAVQFHVRDDFSVGKKIFFPTKEEAQNWMAQPTRPTLDEIKVILRKCEWHKPSLGQTQVWLDFTPG